MIEILRASIEGFAENLSALREFVEVIEPLLLENLRTTLEQHSTGLIPYVLGALATNPTEDAPALVLKGLRRQFPGEIKITPVVGSGLNIQVTGIGAHSFETAMKAIQRSASHQGHLYRSSLITLISAAEWFVAQLVRAHLGL